MVCFAACFANTCCGCPSDSLVRAESKVFEHVNIRHHVKHCTGLPAKVVTSQSWKLSRRFVLSAHITNFTWKFVANKSSIRTRILRVEMLAVKIKIRDTGRLLEPQLIFLTLQQR